MTVKTFALCFYMYIMLLRMESIHGDYVFRVRVHGYNNPTNKRILSSGSTACCDGSDSDVCGGSQRCDNRFRFCLRSPGNRAIGTSTCMSPVLTSTQTNWNGAPIDFTQPTWLGLDNPLMLSGISTAWEGAQLYIEVMDHDFESDGRFRLEYVDVWAIELNPTVLPVSTTLTTSTFTSVFGLANLTMSFQIVCAKSYYGTVCENLNECLSQSINCNQGVCVDGDGEGTCACNPGYTGQFCDKSIDYCLNVNCSGNGQCENLVNSFRCNCTPGFTGDLCDLTDHCEGVNCSGNGDCINELSTYSCNCTPGFTDRDCETDIDDCVGVTCSGRGNCTDLVNDYLCTCDPGYTNRDCETDINECVGQNCSGNGQCVDLVNRFMCDCDLGFTGTLCDSIDDCVGVNCSGNGQCVDGEDSFSCVCASGYTGDQCSIQVVTLSLRVGAVAGGVVGGLLALALLVLLLVVVIVLVSKRVREEAIEDFQQHVVSSSDQCMPGDNPTYGVTIPAQTATMTSVTADFDNPLYESTQLLHEVELENPIYGDPEFADPQPGNTNASNGASAYETPAPVTVYETSELNNERLYQNVSA